MNQTKTLTLDNLRANKTYFIRMLGRNLMGMDSVPLNNYFTTPCNDNDLIQRVKVTFNRNISRFEISEVACAFCAWFSLPWYNVRSLENITCGLQNQTYEWLTTPLTEDYIDSSVLISDTINNNTWMNYLYY